MTAAQPFDVGWLS